MENSKAALNKRDMRSELSIELSPHELERFGVPAARALIAAPNQMSEVDDFCAENGVRMAIVRCAVEEIETAQAIERSGGALMDCLVYYRLDLAEEPPVRHNAFASSRPYRESDASAISYIAETAFAGYVGHYHADSRLDSKAADEGYRDWARRSCTPQSAIVAEDANHNVVGFASLRQTIEHEYDAALFAVASSARGKGVLHLLLQSVAHWAWERGASTCTYSTQITNVAAHRAVVKNGFQFDRALFTFHKWYD